MDISIFGMGYVGTVSGACYAKMGHRVIGVDVNQRKTGLLARGESPIMERDLPGLITEGVRSGSLKVVSGPEEAISASDISFVCVGTPGNGNGSPNTEFIRRVCSDIGQCLRKKHDFHIVAVRSTLLPGGTEEIVIPELEKSSGKKAGMDFGVLFHPEFMREGSSIRDFFHPPMTVIAGPGSHRPEIVSGLYSGIDAPLILTEYRVAEAIKLVSNAFHALKITFANEIGSLCKVMNIDSHSVMEVFCRDEKLNISKAYLKPGFAFGGSCLPKDLRALNHRAKTLDLELPLMRSILDANRIHIERTLELIYPYRGRRIGVLGLSFKAGTDDLRESPMVTLVETLIGKGFQISLYDRHVSLPVLTGANREYILKEIPHISSILTDNLEKIVESSDVLVIGYGEEELRPLAGRLRPDQVIIDLVRFFSPPDVKGKEFVYHGLCW
jgi:GDP-mannose 6-dehydrogenase